MFFDHLWHSTRSGGAVASEAMISHPRRYNKLLFDVPELSAGKGDRALLRDLEQDGWSLVEMGADCLKVSFERAREAHERQYMERREAQESQDDPTPPTYFSELQLLLTTDFPILGFLSQLENASRIVKNKLHTLPRHDSISGNVRWTGAPYCTEPFFMRLVSLLPLGLLGTGPLRNPRRGEEGGPSSESGLKAFSTGQPPLLVEVGSHTGDCSLVALRKFGRLQVLGLEAVREAAAAFQRSVLEHGYERRAEVRHNAVVGPGHRGVETIPGEYEEELSRREKQGVNATSEGLEVSAAGVSSDALRRRRPSVIRIREPPGRSAETVTTHDNCPGVFCHESRAETVVLDDLQSLRERSVIELLKIHCQGCELEALRGMQKHVLPKTCVAHVRPRNFAEPILSERDLLFGGDSWDEYGLAVPDWNNYGAVFEYEKRRRLKRQWRGLDAEDSEGGAAEGATAGAAGAAGEAEADAALGDEKKWEAGPGGEYVEEESPGSASATDEELNMTSEESRAERVRRFVAARARAYASELGATLSENHEVYLIDDHLLALHPSKFGDFDASGQTITNVTGPLEFFEASRAGGSGSSAERREKSESSLSSAKMSPGVSLIHDRILAGVAAKPIPALQVGGFSQAVRAGMGVRLEADAGTSMKASGDDAGESDEGVGREGEAASLEASDAPSAAQVGERWRIGDPLPTEDELFPQQFFRADSSGGLLLALNAREPACAPLVGHARRVLEQRAATREEQSRMEFRFVGGLR